MCTLEDRVKAALRGDPPDTKRRYARPCPSEVGALYGQTPPALELGYDPYPYQKQAAVLLDRAFAGGDDLANLLIASPTGSGKTFAIKWAAKRALEQGLRLIVAVPLVALAEQIFDQLRTLLHDVEVEDFPDDLGEEDDDGFYYDAMDRYCQPLGPESPVGIRTGPSEKYPDAPVLVCTYEVVLIQMNKNPAFMDRVPVLLIDEVHSIADPERGHVPEHLMNHPSLPRDVALVGMSGTLPNALELAEFMGRSNGLRTWVLGADKRPIELTFYAHVAGEDDSEEERESDETTPGSAARGEMRPLYHTGTREFREDAWKRAQSELPETAAQISSKQRTLSLLRQLEDQEMLPAMLVAFSCRGLDTAADMLGSLDLLPARRAKARVHLEFARLRRYVPEEEWPLFAPMLELAARGIGVHHSRKPKHYLELLPRLVRLGKVRLILATSTLSAGIDLPVKTVVFYGGLRMPSAKGFRPIEPNLFHQICGRAGRPGLETEGNVVLVAREPRVDLQALITSGSLPVSSAFRLTPSMVLHALSHEDASVERLIRKSFASADQSHIPGLIQECERDMAKVPVELDTLNCLRALRTAQASAADLPAYTGHALRPKPGDRVVVDPEPPSVRPLVLRLQRGWVSEEIGELDPSWVFRIEGRARKQKRIPLEDAEKLRALDAALDAALATSPRDATGREGEALQLEQWAQALRAQLKPQALWLWPEYRKMVDKMVAHEFVDAESETPTLKGKMAACLVAPEDPLVLVEAWTANLLPRGDVPTFVALLSAFLAQARRNQEHDPAWSEMFGKLQRLRQTFWGCADMKLGSWMIQPLLLWLGPAQASVAHIVEHTDVAPGHFCKELLRVDELLRQIRDAADIAGDPALAAMSDAGRDALVRGLPFTPSFFLR